MQEIITRRPSAVTQLSLNIKVIKKKSGSHLKPVNTLPFNKHRELHIEGVTSKEHFWWIIF